MNKKLLIAVTTIIAFFTFSTLAISQISRKIKDDLYSQIELYSYALTTIQADYVDEKDSKDLIYGSLKGMLSTLDAHSQFLIPEEYKELKTDTQGKFGGLGIEISIKDGLLTVISPIEDTPAWKAGVKAGDRIVKIEDELTRNITLDDAVKKLRGKPKTKVTITVLRESESKILDFTIEREIIHIQDVKYTQILEDNIGYIRLTEFREDSAKSFKKAIEELAKDGADSLIVDLRNNPGGLLNVAIKISEQFLEEGKIIVSTKGRRLSQNLVTYSKNKEAIVDWPVVILINEGSASGSEILAGALKDNKRGIIIGAQSFGKGSVQSVIPMPDGSGLRLTTSKYFTPSGTSIHGTGITPDIEVDFAKTQKIELTETEKKIEEIFSDKKLTKKKKDDDQIKGKTEREIKARKRILGDNQVRAGINVLKGIIAFNSLSEEKTEEKKEEAKEN